MRRSSTLLTRLALALLVALGFAAPVATVDADRVTQTACGKSAVQPQHASSAAAPVLLARGRWLPTAPVLQARAGRLVSQRYLLHRALLL